MSYKGKYKPTYPEKYLGDPTNIIYRSLWERKFCKYCDLNDSIIKWASEEITIPYRSPIDNRIHRYFPDFYIKYKDVKKDFLFYFFRIKIRTIKVKRRQLLYFNYIIKFKKLVYIAKAKENDF